MEMERLRDLFEEHIKDVYSGEQQILESLPDMIEAAGDERLRDALQEHLEETRQQKKRLEEIAASLGFDPGGHTCEGMKGILKEGSQMVEKESKDDDVRDAAIIAAAQRVEHYEMAAYGTTRTLARTLGENDVADKLQQTLDEEKQADRKLTSIAESGVNREAMAAD